MSLACHGQESMLRPCLQCIACGVQAYMGAPALDVSFGAVSKRGLCRFSKRPWTLVQGRVGVRIAAVR